MADPRFPHRRGPWNARQVEEIKAWRRRFLQEDRSGSARGDGDGEAGSNGGGDGDALNLARADKQVSIQLKIERRAKLIAERLIIEQKYVKREEHEAAAAKKYEAVKKGLLQVAKALRQRLADEADPAKVEEILAGALRAVMNRGFNAVDGVETDDDDGANS